MEKFIIRNTSNGLFFLGYPARFTTEQDKAQAYWSMRGARTAVSHLHKRIERRGVPCYLEIIPAEALEVCQYCKAKVSKENFLHNFKSCKECYELDSKREKGILI